jgi:hypothetical protein
MWEREGKSKQQEGKDRGKVVDKEAKGDGKGGVKEKESQVKIDER